MKVYIIICYEDLFCKKKRKEKRVTGIVLYF